MCRSMRSHIIRIVSFMYAMHAVLRIGLLQAFIACSVRALFVQLLCSGPSLTAAGCTWASMHVDRLLAYADMETRMYGVRTASFF